MEGDSSIPIWETGDDTSNSFSEGVSDSLHCGFCKITLTNEARYTAHIGTKKHKRNISAARKEVRTHGYAVESRESIVTDPLEKLSPREVLEYSDHKGINLEKFVQNSETQDSTTSCYVTPSIAHWCVDLALNPTVETFSITVNDKKVPNRFGNAVMEVRFRDLPGKEPTTSLSLVQFRNVESNVDRTVESFTRGKFSYEDILAEIEKVPVVAADHQPVRYNDIREKPNQTINFCIVTTWRPGPDLERVVKICDNCHKMREHCNCSAFQAATVMAKPLKKKGQILVNTSEYNENVYRFFKLGDDPLPKLYLYTSQKKLTDFPSGIDRMLTNRIGISPSEGVADEFMDYISRWTKDRNHFYKLTKEDVLVKLGELLLEPFTCPVRPPRNSSTDNALMWVRAVKSLDITVLDIEEDLPMLLEPWHFLTEEKLGGTVDVLNGCFHFSRKSNQKGADQFLWKYLDEELPSKTLANVGPDQEELIVPLNDVYLAMWKAGLMPLVLKTKGKDEQTIQKMMETLEELKKCGLTRRYFVVTGVPKQLRALSRNLKVFSSVWDLQKNFYSLDVHVGDGIPLNYARDLESSDQYFKKIISPKDFYYMSSGQCYLKMSTERKEDTQEDLAKLALTPEVMKTVRERLEAGTGGTSEGEVSKRKRLRSIDPATFE